MEKSLLPLCYDYLPPQFERASGAMTGVRVVLSCRHVLHAAIRMIE